MAGRVRHLVAVACVVLAVWCLAGCDRALAVGTGALLVEPARMQAELPGALVVDIRTQAEYEAGHIPGSVRVSTSELHGFFYRIHKRGDRPVVVVCESGINASLAVPVARREGLDESYVLAGGMRRWRVEGRPVGPGPVTPEVESTAPPERSLTRPQQLVAFLSGGVIKPTYMFLTLVVAWALRRGKSPALRLLLHGSLWFFVGEAFCALNYYFHSPGFAYPIDLLHGAGMARISDSPYLDMNETAW